jgi:alanine-synthesizing transaminase
MREAKVAVAPGVGFGEHGDQHVRIALVENKHRIRQAVRNIKAFLGGTQDAMAQADLESQKSKVE